MPLTEPAFELPSSAIPAGATGLGVSLHPAAMKPATTTARYLEQRTSCLSDMTPPMRFHVCGPLRGEVASPPIQAESGTNVCNAVDCTRARPGRSDRPAAGLESWRGASAPSAGAAGPSRTARNGPPHPDPRAPRRPAATDGARSRVLPAAARVEHGAVAEPGAFLCDHRANDEAGPGRRRPRPAKREARRWPARRPAGARSEA